MGTCAGRFSNHTVFQYYKNDSAGSVEMVDCDKLRGRPAEFGGDCATFLPSDNTYQAVVNVPGKLGWISFTCATASIMN